MLRLRTTLRLLTVGGYLLSGGLLVAAEPVKDLETALDRYVAKPDPSYAWKVVKVTPGDGYKVFAIHLTSQTWRTTADVDRTVWEHWLLVVRPDKVDSDKALLFISGGSNKAKDPPNIDETFVKIAQDTNSVAAELKMVPNQPLVFGGDGKGRTEDDLIGYTWDKYLTTGDETWPARLPMTKSAVRAMDTITAFMASPEGGMVQVDKFVVSGGSKRGWTTWTTAAVDARVVGIVPFVIDVLNVKKSMDHHHASYGFWAPAVGDYVRHKLVHRADTPEYAKLMEIEDPFTYRARFTMPKLVVNAAGDEFFLPDSSQFYFDELPGEKYLRYVPNGNHSLAGTDARETLQAFYESILHDSKRPEYSWELGADGSIVVDAKTPPKEVLLWQATNPRARDFRVDSIGRTYKSTPLTANAEGKYVGKIDAPASGYTAYFVELTFDTGGKYPLKLTSPVRVLPEKLPHVGKQNYKKAA
ncbi:MAG: PhoPQ-activated pathogenicity-related family protein [Planctomycetaceae bacterium]|nr:PhoPQ-activated pathogenicity-related family protein [Planctomycetaceae bacterium]